MRKLPLLALGLVVLISCQYIPACLMENPFASKVIVEVVEDVAEGIEEAVESEKANPPSCIPVCPKDLKAI